MNWREEITGKPTKEFKYLSKEDVKLLIDNKDFEFEKGGNYRYYDSEIHNLIDENEVTLHGFFTIKGDSLKKYVRVTISDNYGTLEYESDFSSFEGDFVSQFSSTEDVDYFLNKLFEDYK